MRAVLKGDLISGAGRGDIVGPEIPEELAGVPTTRLRFVDGQLIDAAGLNEFWIDDLGQKHAVPGDGWQLLTCAVDTPIEPGPDGWIVVDPGVASKRALIAYAANLRWRLEVGGIVVAGVAVATDDRSKVMITGARVAAMADPGWSTVWHGADGQTYPLDVAAMVAISDEVQAHVNAGFATFAGVKAGIEAGTVTTIAAVDAAFGAA